MKNRRSLVYRARLKFSIVCERFAICKTLLRLRKEPTIFLFGSPRHSNMGDQAQTYCIKRWAKSNYPEYNVVVFNYYISIDRILGIVRKCIKPSDMIFCHSGYHLTDLYPEKDIYCKVIRLFPDHRILVFPQTVNFIKNKTDEKYVVETFNKHGKVTLCCRDEVSYESAKNLFVNCKLFLYPDIVTSLIGTKTFSHKRDGVLFCMRNDVEAFYKSEQIQTLMKKFVNMKVRKTDTTIDTTYTYIRHHREEILEQIFDDFSRYKVVITDRYHGTIFSLVAGTPVIVISSTDHKLSSGVKWFPESFSKYVHYARNLEQAYDMAQEVLSDNTLTHQLQPYFEENYYSKLKERYESM